MKKFIFPGLPAVAIVTIFSMFGLSCQKNTSGPNGSGAQHAVRIFLTDDPSLVFDQVFIDIQKLEIKVEDSLEREQERHDGQGGDDHDRNGGGGGGWMTLPIHPGVYDVLQFRNGLDTLFATGTFSSLRQLRKIRLTLGTNNSVVLNGVSIPLTVGDKNNIIVIKLSDDFLDDNPVNFDFSIDFDAGRSIRQHGHELELNPQVKAFRKERSASIEGKVLPLQAQAVVMAISGTDTSISIPGREGEFKLPGLKAGVYSVLVHATAGGYVDSVLNNIVVAGKEDTHLGTITLHP